MAASEVTERYPATAEAAWELIGDFSGIGAVFQGVADVVVEDDVRTFTLMGMRISEQLRSRDDATRTLTYSIIGGVDGIVSHEATMRVEPHDGGCEIRWSVTTDPEAAQPIFADAYRQALTSLHGALGGS